jgi:hypothetical protein
MRQFLPRLAICRGLEFSSPSRVLARLAAAANRRRCGPIFSRNFARVLYDDKGDAPYARKG